MPGEISARLTWGMCDWKMFFPQFRKHWEGEGFSSAFGKFLRAFLQSPEYSLRRTLLAALWGVTELLSERKRFIHRRFLTMLHAFVLALTLNCSVF